MKQVTNPNELKSLQTLFQPCAKLLVPLHELLSRHDMALPAEEKPSVKKPLVFAYGREMFALHISSVNQDHTVVQSLKHAEHRSDRTFEILRQLDARPNEIGVVIAETWRPDYRQDCKLYLK